MTPPLQTLCRLFEHNSFEVIQARTVPEAVNNAEHFVLDLVLLDLYLGGDSGYSVIHAVRNLSDIPIIILSSDDNLDIKLEALNLGAVDYIVKPFEPREVLARSLATIRQYRSGFNKQFLEIGPCKLDFIRQAFRCPNCYRPLSRMEFLLLKLLAESPDYQSSHQEIILGLWGRYDDSRHQSLRVLIRTIRHKIEPAPSNPRFLLSVPGYGYALNVEAPK